MHRFIIIRIILGLPVWGFISTNCRAQQHQRAEDLIKACADRQDGLLCDSALVFLARLPMSDEVRLLHGHAAFTRFKVEQKNMLAPAYAAIGEAYYNPARGYQYIGAANRAHLVALAQEAIRQLTPVKKDPAARLALRELENALDDMTLE